MTQHMPEPSQPPVRFYSPDGRFVQTARGWENVTRETWPPMSPDGKSFWDGAAWRPWGRKKSPAFLIIVLLIVAGFAWAVVAEWDRTSRETQEGLMVMCESFPDLDHCP